MAQFQLQGEIISRMQSRVYSEVQWIFAFEYREMGFLHKIHMKGRGLTRGRCLLIAWQLRGSQKEFGWGQMGLNKDNNSVWFLSLQIWEYIHGLVKGKNIIGQSQVPPDLQKDMKNTQSRNSSLAKFPWPFYIIHKINSQYTWFFHFLYFLPFSSLWMPADWVLSKICKHNS